MGEDKGIKDSPWKSGIKRDVDVSQLSFTNKKLSSVPDLLRFRFLRELWLNNNKIRELSCRSINCCLTELYLHNNNIKSISGALNHLTCLRVLLLHNNQIRGLEATMHELRRMQQLQTATFFLNPISHEPGYRLYVIHCLPSVQVLDGKEVKPVERRRSFQTHRQEHHRVLQCVAFGRRENPNKGHELLRKLSASGLQLSEPDGLNPHCTRSRCELNNAVNTQHSKATLLMDLVYY